jgi:hypothetical protein
MNTTLNNAALQDTFWQSLPSEPTLTDEESDCESIEGMTRVSSQEFRFCREDQRITMITPTAADEAGSPPEDSEGTLQEDVLFSSFGLLNESYTEVPEDESDNNGIVVLNDCPSVEDASYCKSSGTNTSDSTVPTISPPPSESPSQHSRPKANKRIQRTRQNLRKESSFYSNNSSGEKGKTSSHSLGKTTISSVQTSTINRNTKINSSPSNKTKQKKMTRSLVSCCHSDGTDTETVDGTVFGNLGRTCESMFGPLVFGFWDDCDRDNGSDDATLATYETQLSYEEEQGVSVLIAVQVRL